MYTVSICIRAGVEEFQHRNGTACHAHSFDRLGELVKTTRTYARHTTDTLVRKGSSAKLNHFVKAQAERPNRQIS